MPVAGIAASLGRGLLAKRSTAFVSLRADTKSFARDLVNATTLTLGFGAAFNAALRRVDPGLLSIKQFGYELKLLGRTAADLNVPFNGLAGLFTEITKSATGGLKGIRGQLEKIKPLVISLANKSKPGSLLQGVALSLLDRGFKERKFPSQLGQVQSAIGSFTFGSNQQAAQLQQILNVVERIAGKVGPG